MDMKEFKDQLGQTLFGVIPSQSIKNHTCVKCKLHIDVAGLGSVDAAEFNISGVCPTCWDAMEIAEDKQDYAEGDE
jgi:hypothetical protein